MTMQREERRNVVLWVAGPVTVRATFVVLTAAALVGSGWWLGRASILAARAAAVSVPAPNVSPPQDVAPQLQLRYKVVYERAPACPQDKFELGPDGNWTILRLFVENHGDRECYVQTDPEVEADWENAHPRHWLGRARLPVTDGDWYRNGPLGTFVRLQPVGPPAQNVVPDTVYLQALLESDEVDPDFRVTVSIRIKVLLIGRDGRIFEDIVTLRIPRQRVGDMPRGYALFRPEREGMPEEVPLRRGP